MWYEINMVWKAWKHSAVEALYRIFVFDVSIDTSWCDLGHHAMLDADLLNAKGQGTLENNKFDKVLLVVRRQKCL